MPRFGELAVDEGPHVSSVATRELEPLKHVRRHGIGQAERTNLRPLSQLEPQSILILQQTDLRVHYCMPGRHRGKVQGDSPRLGGDTLAWQFRASGQSTTIPGRAQRHVPPLPLGNTRRLQRPG